MHCRGGNPAADLPRSVDYHGGVGDVDLLVDYDRGFFLIKRVRPFCRRLLYMIPVCAAELPRSVDYHGGVGDVDLLVDYDRRLFFGWRFFEERVVV